jgi:hypothetical protein
VLLLLLLVVVVLLMPLTLLLLAMLLAWLLSKVSALCLWRRRVWWGAPGGELAPGGHLTPCPRLAAAVRHALFPCCAACNRSRLTARCRFLGNLLPAALFEVPTTAALLLLVGPAAAPARRLRGFMLPPMPCQLNVEVETVV